MLDLSSNQLNHLDEDYIHQALNIVQEEDLAQELLENDKYFNKTWEKFNVRHMYGGENEILNEDTKKTRLINQNVMRELKKEKLIEASSQ